MSIDEHERHERDEEDDHEEKKTGGRDVTSNTRTPTLGHHPRSGRGIPAHTPQEEEGDRRRHEEEEEEEEEEEDKGTWPAMHAPTLGGTPPRSGRGKPAHAPQEEDLGVVFGHHRSFPKNAM